MNDPNNGKLNPNNGIPPSENHPSEKNVPTDKNFGSAPPPPNEFKLAEIWIKEGALYLQAVNSFWDDIIRAIGILEACKDIVKQGKPQPPKSKIITPQNSMLNFVRRKFNKK